MPAALGRHDLMEDPRFATLETRQENAEALTAILDEVIGGQDVDYWRNAFREYRVTAGFVSKTEDIYGDEQAIRSGAVVPGAVAGLGANYIIDSPLWVEGSPKQAPLPAPEKGEHTLEILVEAGYDEAGIASLRAHGAFGSDF